MSGARRKEKLQTAHAIRLKWLTIYNYMVLRINERYTTSAAADRKANVEREPPLKEPTRGQPLREVLQQAKDELKALEGESMSKEKECDT